MGVTSYCKFKYSFHFMNMTFFIIYLDEQTLSNFGMSYKGLEYW